MGDEEVPGHGASQSEPFRDCSKLTNPEAADPKGQKKVRKNLDATTPRTFTCDRSVVQPKDTLNF